MQNVSSSLAWDFTSSWCVLLAVLGCLSLVWFRYFEGWLELLKTCLTEAGYRLILTENVLKYFIYFFKCLQRKATIPYSSWIVTVGFQ